MKTVGELVNTTDLNNNESAISSTSKPISTLSDRHVARFFAKMKAMYLNTWSSNFKTEQDLKAAMNVWANGLGELHQSQIVRGLSACESRPGFPPTLGEFKRLALQLPTKSQTIARIAADDTRDPLSLSIVRAIGGFNLRQMSEDALARRVAALYDEHYEDVFYDRVGEPDEWEPEKRLDYEQQPEDPPLDRESAKVALKKLKAERESLGD